MPKGPDNPTRFAKNGRTRVTAECLKEPLARLANHEEKTRGFFFEGRFKLLVDYTGRLFRDGKAVISREVAAIFDRVGTTAETWQARLQKLSEGPLLGRFSPSASHPSADLRSSTSRRTGSG